jgi:hypothetical protein
VLVDLLTVYGEGGKAIVFTQTKREADEVAASVGGHLPCGALHGDMSQREREKVLAAFRANKLTVLVATDVAARGLDIPDVDLVVHYELPQDPESFLHRSGRTGRAGKSGTAIAMFQPKEIGYFKRILRETETQGVKLIPAPSPTQVIEAAAKQVMYRLDGVDEEVKSYFAPVAKLVLSSRDPQEAMVAALAALSGIQEVPEPRSLLTLEEGVQTLQIMSKPGRIVRPSHVRCGPRSEPAPLKGSAPGCLLWQPCPLECSLCKGLTCLSCRCALPPPHPHPHTHHPLSCLQRHCGQAAGGHAVQRGRRGPHPHAGGGRRVRCVPPAPALRAWRPAPGCPCSPRVAWSGMTLRYMCSAPLPACPSEP